MKLDVPQPQSGLQERLMEDSISVLKPAQAISFSAESSVSEAVEMMKQRHVGCILVMEGRELAGIFSERDFLLKAVGSGRDWQDIQLREVMTPRPVTLSPEHSIRFALHEMSVGGFRHVPLVRNHEPVGIISARDVIGYLGRQILKSELGTAAGAAANTNSH
ncbi:MAG: CBS domain-containing protein [Acidobacteria bacterium]|nr:CBS domain-containing protein [Acidobacteriota bacterium]MCI0627873.1 CBS domain-containing protein [Acidobacteriota bacterium]MCI0723496.1 CBS domain-containing protein [Acidobacteriota bacterium]